MKRHVKSKHKKKKIVLTTPAIERLFTEAQKVKGVAKSDN